MTCDVFGECDYIVIKEHILFLVLVLQYSIFNNKFVSKIFIDCSFTS